MAIADRGCVGAGVAAGQSPDGNDRDVTAITGITAIDHRNIPGADSDIQGTRSARFAYSTRAQIGSYPWGGNPTNGLR